MVVSYHLCQTLEVDVIIHSMSFTNSGQYLKTNRRAILLTMRSTMRAIQRHCLSLRVAYEDMNDCWTFSKRMM